MGFEGDGQDTPVRQRPEDNVTAEQAAASRRGFLKSAGLGLAGAALAGLSAPPTAGAAETPIGDKWWPSKWGADDQAGASNHMGPQKTLEAVQHIKTGKVHSLGHV